MSAAIIAAAVLVPCLLSVADLADVGGQAAQFCGREGVGVVRLDGGFQRVGRAVVQVGGGVPGVTQAGATRPVRASPCTLPLAGFSVPMS